MPNKKLLSSAQVGSLVKAGFTKLIKDRNSTGNFYGAMSGIDYEDSYVFSGNAGNSRTLLGSFVTEVGYVTILSEFYYDLLQAGNATKDVVFEIETKKGEDVAVVAAFQAVSTAGAKVRTVPVIPALTENTVFRIFATTTTGSGADCNGEIRVLKIEV